MKKLFLTLLVSFLVIPVFAVNEVIYDPVAGTLYLPRVIAQGDPSGAAYTVLLQDTGDFTFTVASATEIVTPEQFSVDYLQGKTFYFVYFGTGVDINDNNIENVPVVEEIVFGFDGTVSTTGLLNGSTATGINYEIDDSGQATFGSGSEESEVSVITCGSTAQYIQTEHSSDGSFTSSNPVDLYFFNVSDAFTFANSLTAPIPRCELQGTNQLVYVV